MQVLLNTDKNVEGREALAIHVEAVVSSALSKYGDHITRVEVHLSDEAGGKTGSVKKCVMEARLAGLQPLAATQEAETLNGAIDGASKKLQRLLDTAVGKINHS